MVATPSARLSSLSAPVHVGQWVNHDHDGWGGWSDTANPGLAADPAGCDPIDPSQCMLPYPNDWFTRYDPATATTRRLDLNIAAMPRNIGGKPIVPTAWNAGDGFSAGSQILTVVPGMTSNKDLVPSGLPPDTDLAMNDDPSSLGVILLDATTGEIQPVWVEVDQYTSEAGLVPAGAVGTIQQDLMIHPAKNLLDGHRYIVALRHLSTDTGARAQPSAAFTAYRDGAAPVSDPRTSHMDKIFADLAEAGWNRSSLYLAWDFTTASTRSVTGRLLAIRDDALSQLGETKADMGKGLITPDSKSPAFTVESVTNFTPSQNVSVARRITGTFTVPCYIAPTCSPPEKCDDLYGTVAGDLGTVGSTLGGEADAFVNEFLGALGGSPFDDCPSPGEFALNPVDPYAVPHQVAGQTYQANFICNVGRHAFEAGQLLRPVEFGHGLFGTASQVNGRDNEALANLGMMYCATDWFGFSESDVPNAVVALADLSNFPILVDRTEQGELNFLYLQRVMIGKGGFSSNAAFQYGDGRSFIDTSHAYYHGSSQGGIYGGTVCAISVDVKHCALGVPGMDYSMLLPRSSDYVANEDIAQLLAQDATSPTNIPGDLGYSQLLDLFYPDQATRQLTLDLIQNLWDRADPDGYATHMTATAGGGLLPDTPDHQVLMQMAWGDHQVADITAEDEARTIGAEGIEPELLASRLSGTNDPIGPYSYSASSPFWDIKAIGSLPYAGSAIVVFDAGPAGADGYGTSPPPPSDVPDPVRSDGDPHGAPNYSCAAQDQIAAFLTAGGAITEPAQPNNLGGGPPPYFSGGWNGTCQV
ncbi:MAG TPA: hypothetical protein VMV14_09700 [Acidimicrobiales bacterium]|nr:hypothetical protein [Acidimicrobiales bacterium]